jgi:hypothetical protein
MIQWMIADEIDIVTGILCIFAGLGLGAYTMMSKDPVTRPYFVIAALSMLVLFPWIRNLLEKRALVNLDYETMERAYETLGLYPTHLGAKLKIAKGLYTRGHYRQAITLAEKALENTPKRLAEDEYRLVRDWRKDNPEFEPLKWMACQACGCNNSPTDFFCAHCAKPLWMVVARHGAFSSETANTLLLAWLGGVVGLVGIPLTSTYVPAELKTPVVVGILIVAATFVFGALRRSRMTA